MTASLLSRIRRAASSRLRNAVRRILPHPAEFVPADLKRDVVVTGYYGAGNLGDDILAHYVLELVCKSVPAARVLVDAPLHSYLERWFPGIKCMPLAMIGTHARGAERKMIFGGGGLFHSFTPPTSENLWGLENSTIHAYRQRFGPDNWKRARKYAFCVGIGPLHGDGARWIAASLLREFEHISVRDPESSRQLAELAVPDAVLSADPSIGLSQRLPAATTPRRRALGIVVRNWTHSANILALVDSLHSAAKRLRAAGWLVEFVSFEAGGDGVAQSAEQRLVQKGEAIHTWQPQRDSIFGFCEYLRQYPVVLTMRAHGVFLGALLGSTPVAVSLEPKLDITASACGFSDHRIPIEADPDQIVAAVNRALDTVRAPDWSESLRRLQAESDRLVAWIRSP